ncbi:uncharacterized protein PV09_01023 [Verruconis gallopava]|uniref:Ubiquitin carboxyl-terminal hydrolase n=1 Tax=Verruconis gallopava TaxID=253628 RepID=A0A0D2AN04_9PEZI|nr:uncharacterized protein PV09_01023 [Verruconis gallopava]KIW08083.1 hypothetical protein PV09_01023 [Verruconis gallopava]
MPDKPLTIATYAAGASLAAITLVYVFGPTFLLDGNESANIKPSSRRPAVGLFNPANDCFINSVLQALAGLPHLRKYLIRETHRRRLDGEEIYKVTDEDLDSGLSETKLLRLQGLRAGIVTQALKDILDNLNERPIYKKTISAQPFVVALEKAFQTRISRQQQDAQEFLQVVAERICDEYHAGAKARKHAQELTLADLQIHGKDADSQKTTKCLADAENTVAESERPSGSESPSDDDQVAQTLKYVNPQEEEDGFPLEGKIESHIECQTCGFKPKSSISNFVTLTLHVPQKNSTTLNQCFDGMLKVEVIEGYKCDKCRLEHALVFKKGQLHSTLDSPMRQDLEAEIEKIEKAIEDDPEKPPEGVQLPDLKFAPKRTIKKHMRIAHFPKVLAIHLSRSIFETHYSSKNMAKVSFPEILPLGSIVDQKRYRLLCVVSHKGGHNSGHYETFRRQVTTTPFSTPHSFGAEGAYSRSGSPSLSTVASPRLTAINGKKLAGLSGKSPLSPKPQTDYAVAPSDLSSPLHPSPSTSSLSSRSSFSLSGSLRRKSRPPTSAPRDSTTAFTESNTNTKPNEEQVPSLNFDSAPAARKSSASHASQSTKKRKKSSSNNRWWRISDEKVKESKTSEVLSQQKEVYLLFYELMDESEEE